MTKNKRGVQKRDLQFVDRPETCIWEEQPSFHNPYLAEKCRCHGYDLLELVHKRSFVEVLYLLFLGELPARDQAQLLEILMVSFINPGPRHAGVRAAMNAAVSRADTAHLLPIGLAVMGGDHLGGGEVMSAMRFFLAQEGTDPREVASNLLNNEGSEVEGDQRVAPGFGSRFGGIDPLPAEIAAMLVDLSGSGKFLEWGDEFAGAIASTKMGWLTPGVCGAVFCDLGLPPRAGAGLFQLISSPGVLAHSLEMADKPLTAMPFLDEEHYVIEPEARKG